jgi:N,N-dimethylformamidase
MTYDELPITGYLDRFSHRPGEEFTAHIGLRRPGPYRARLVRVVSGDPNPAGPGMRLDHLASVFDQRFEGVNQPIHLGSCAVTAPLPPRDPGAAVTYTALVWPGVTHDGQAVLHEDGPWGGVTLSVGAGGVALEVGGLALRTGVGLERRRWYRVWAALDPATGRALVGQTALETGRSVTRLGVVAPLRAPAGGAIVLAARDALAPRAHFTGKLEAPTILAGFVTGWSGALDPAEITPGRLIAAWDFAREIPSQTVIDIGPAGRHGQLRNLPTRAMAGARWAGTETCWRHAPRDYAAIHFHADDLGDCGWHPSFTWTVPDDLPSGAYAFEISCAEGLDRLPFYVTPPKSGPCAKIAFLASTFTYQAYANHARGMDQDSYARRVAAWGAVPANPDAYPLYGRSLYNAHLDDSGIAFSSRRRPVLTMRPGFVTFDHASGGSGLRHYPADTHLLAWLDAKGIACDIITDEDLDDEGVDLLRPYRAILTSSHPEYHTPGTLDALFGYTRAGGRLAYLGGNGFYWRVARDKTMPWAIELRRGEGGIRTWAAEPGEYFHQLDGQYGGLWRRNRRPPQLLAGVGFSAQGAFESSYYRLLPAAREQRFAWLFDGVEGEIIGDYGLSGGGAAGFELDRADTDLGTPYDAVILARSENPPASFFTVHEEVLAGRRTITGETPEALLRAEIVYFEPPGGGAVFSVGSITFLGSLWRNGWEGPISRLLENVVARFSV